MSDPSTLRLAFQRSLGTAWDRVIEVATVPIAEWGTPSAVVHVESLFGEDAFSAQIEQGTRWIRNIDLSNTKIWSTIETYLAIPRTLIPWCVFQEGLPYDMV